MGQWTLVIRGGHPKNVLNIAQAEHGKRVRDIEQGLKLVCVHPPRGVDVNQRTVSTYFYSLLQGIKFGHIKTSYLYYLSFIGHN